MAPAIDLTSGLKWYTSMGEKYIRNMNPAMSNGRNEVSENPFLRTTVIVFINKNIAVITGAKRSIAIRTTIEVLFPKRSITKNDVQARAARR